MNLKQIIFLQRQIKKFLLSKNNPNKLFQRPPQSKTKNNYLFLNDTNKELNEENTNINDSQKEKENPIENEVNDDSFLNNEIKYVENLRIQNATYTGEVLNGKRHGKGIQI
jgi:hypothetical protein